jgi:hypothetical protein
MDVCNEPKLRHCGLRRIEHPARCTFIAALEERLSGSAGIPEEIRRMSAQP